MTKRKDSLKKMPEKSSEIIIYQTEGGQAKLEVRLQDETVWLTQQLMAELFQTTQQNISLHISNIYEEKELSSESTHKKYLSVQKEGTRDVKRKRDHYNLDMIISVGYRVKSHIATRFRQWATQRLKGELNEDYQGHWRHYCTLVLYGDPTLSYQELLC